VWLRASFPDETFFADISGTWDNGAGIDFVRPRAPPRRG